MACTTSDDLSAGAGRRAAPHASRLPARTYLWRTRQSPPRLHVGADSGEEQAGFVVEYRHLTQQRPPPPVEGHTGWFVDCQEGVNRVDGDDGARQRFARGG